MHKCYLLGRPCGQLSVARIMLSIAFLLAHLHLTNWSAAKFWQNFLLCSSILATLVYGDFWHGHAIYVGYWIFPCTFTFDQLVSRHILTEFSFVQVHTCYIDDLWHGHAFYVGYSNHMDSCSAHYFWQGHRPDASI